MIAEPVLAAASQAAAPTPDQIARLRRFSRFYTRKLGLLQHTLLDSELSLTEARVLYELAAGQACVASVLARAMRVDPGYLSRRLSALVRRGLVSRAGTDIDRRRRTLALTPAGRAVFADLDAAANTQVAQMLAPLADDARAELVGAMGDIERLLEPDALAPVVLRGHRVGDIGWVTHRQGLLYAQEYGWDASYEALVAEIAARFVREFDPRHERCWIAEIEGRVVGSVFLVRESPAVARLRLLYVEPVARGRAIGRRLVDECIAFARAHGYTRLVLWTNDVLVSAGRIYRAAGFRLVREEAHHAFGKDLVSQDWELALAPDGR